MRTTFLTQNVHPDHPIALRVMFEYTTSVAHGSRSSLFPILRDTIPPWQALNLGIATGFDLKLPLVTLDSLCTQRRLASNTRWLLQTLDARLSLESCAVECDGPICKPDPVPRARHRGPTGPTVPRTIS